MRLRLAHMLSLLLVGAVALAVVGMGMASAWNLQHGFSKYIAARDAEQLERLASWIEAALAGAGGVEGLKAGDFDLRRMVHEFDRSEGRSDGRMPGHHPPGAEGPPGGMRPPEGAGRPGGAGLPGGAGVGPPGGVGIPASAEPPGALLRRLGLVTPDGQALLSRPLPPWETGYTERPLYWNGGVVAKLRMLPAPPVPDSVQTTFLQSQYSSIVAVAFIVLLLSLIGAYGVAQRWVKPLLAVQATAARLARGELTARLREDHSGAGRSAEIDDVVRNINRMAEGLQTLEGARRRWLADISHELRTPLTVLRGEIEALLDGVRPLRREALVSLQHESARLSRLVEDLHLLALSDLKALPCHRVDLDAAALVRGMADRGRQRAAARGLVFDARVPEQPVTVCWDAARIEQLIDNLLENSMRYTDVPGMTRLTMHCDDDTVTLTVDDSPPGVPVDDLPRLFEPLYRSDSARSRAHGGSGLGLSICQAIAQAHDGSIDAGLSLLGGLQVRVHLPRQFARPTP